MGTAGAFYRLLKRSGASGMALPLRHASIAANLVSEAEFSELKAFVHSGVRAFTLVPINAVASAIAMYGSTPASEALIDALSLSRPAEWPSVDVVMQGEEGEESDEGEDGKDGEESNEGDEGEEEEDGEEEGEDEESDEEVLYSDEEEDGDQQSDGSGDRSNRGYRVDHSGSGDGGSSNDPSQSRSHHDEQSADEDADKQSTGRGRSHSIAVSEALEAQLQAFASWRIALVNRQRQSTHVLDITAADDRRSILQFFSWLHCHKGVVAPSFQVFVSAKLGSVVQCFIVFKAQT